MMPAVSKARDSLVASIGGVASSIFVNAEARYFRCSGEREFFYRVAVLVDAKTVYQGEGPCLSVLVEAAEDTVRKEAHDKERSTRGSERRRKE